MTKNLTKKILKNKNIEVSQLEICNEFIRLFNEKDYSGMKRFFNAYLTSEIQKIQKDHL